MERLSGRDGYEKAAGGFPRAARHGLNMGLPLPPTGSFALEAHAEPPAAGRVEMEWMENDEIHDGRKIPIVTNTVNAHFQEFVVSNAGQCNRATSLHRGDRRSLPGGPERAVLS